MLRQRRRPAPRAAARRYRGLGRDHPRPARKPLAELRLRGGGGSNSRWGRLCSECCDDRGRDRAIRLRLRDSCERFRAARPARPRARPPAPAATGGATPPNRRSCSIGFHGLIILQLLRRTPSGCHWIISAVNGSRIANLLDSRTRPRPEGLLASDRRRGGLLLREKNSGPLCCSVRIERLAWGKPQCRFATITRCGKKLKCASGRCPPYQLR